MSTTTSLPTAAIFLTVLSTVFAIIAFTLSTVSITTHITTTSAWFGIITSFLTILFHGVTIIKLRNRRKARGGNYLVEKGLLVGVENFDADKEIFCTNSSMACFGILFALWVVGVGAILCEVVLVRPAIAIGIEKGNTAVLCIETCLMGALTIRSYVLGRSFKVTTQKQVRPSPLKYVYAVANEPGVSANPTPAYGS